MERCTIDACTGYRVARGFCGKHYARWRKYDDPLDDGSSRRRQKATGPCSVDGCNEEVKRRKLCGRHYGRWQVYGDPLGGGPLREKRPDDCTVEGCNGKHKGHGFCEKHLDRWRDHGDPLGGEVFRVPAGGPCVIEGCSGIADARGMCTRHYQRWRTHRDPSFTKQTYADPARRQWHKQGSTGYVWRYEPENPNKCPSGHVYQHRHVMSEMLGRPLRKGENVHHRNGVKEDNRPENLELWVRGQPTGTRVKDLVAWARKIIEDYGHLVPQSPTL